MVRQDDRFIKKHYTHFTPLEKEIVQSKIYRIVTADWDRDINITRKAEVTHVFRNVSTPWKSVVDRIPNGYVVDYRRCIHKSKRERFLVRVPADKPEHDTVVAFERKRRYDGTYEWVFLSIWDNHVDDWHPTLDMTGYDPNFVIDPYDDF